MKNDLMKRLRHPSFYILHFAFSICLCGCFKEPRPAYETVPAETQVYLKGKGLEVLTTEALMKDGVVYVAVNLGAFNTENRAKSWVYAYRDSDLAFLKKWPLPEAVHGAGGMTAKGDRFYVVGGLPKTYNENYVYEYTSDFVFAKRHVLASGWTNLGIQTVDFQRGHFVFGTYGQKRKEGEKQPPSTMVAPADLSSVRFVEGDYVGEGVVWFKDKVWRAAIRCLNPKAPHADRRFISWITPAQFTDSLH